MIFVRTNFSKEFAFPRFFVRPLAIAFSIFPRSIWQGIDCFAGYTCYVFGTWKAPQSLLLKRRIGFPHKSVFFFCQFDDLTDHCLRIWKWKALTTFYLRQNSMNLCVLRKCCLISWLSSRSCFCSTNVSEGNLFLPFITTATRKWSLAWSLQIGPATNENSQYKQTLSI